MQPHFSGDTGPEQWWVTNHIKHTQDALRMPGIPAHL